MKSVWEDTDCINAHLNDEERHYKRFEKYVIPYINFNNRSVIDYGCGGAWLGKLLLEKYKIKNYCGIDISERSLKFAANNLCSFRLYKLYHNLEMNEADILICLTVIQHFFTLKVLRDFLKMCNKSKIKTILLQIRYSMNNKNIFIKDNKNKKDVIMACQTSEKYITKNMNNYKLDRIIEYKKPRYLYLFYGRKND